MPQFVRDVEDIRRRAINKIEEGAVTESYRGDAHKTVAILNEALATEIVCVLRYQHHYFMATGVHGKAVADEFKEHADAEREHADRIAERIQQLGGKPDFNPRNLLERSVSQYVEGETLADMIREDLIAERVVIEVYHEMVRYFGHNDPTTRVIIEQILSDEEEHASDLVDLLYVVDPKSGETRGLDPGTNPLRGREGGDGSRRQQRGQSGREPLITEGETCEMELRAEGRGRQGRGNREQRQPRRDLDLSQVGDGSPAVQPVPREIRKKDFTQQLPGRTFAGSDRPNPPGVAGSRAQQPERQERGRRGRRGRRRAA